MKEAGVVFLPENNGNANIYQTVNLKKNTKI